MHSRSDDGGFILVALLVAIAIAAVWMSAAIPAWRQQATREKEAELIFRGEQYARAILLYQQKMNNVLPSSFDDLVSQHTLRHKWKDPITDDEFLPKVGCVGVGVGGPVQGGNGRGGLTSPVPSNPPGRGGTGPTGQPPSPIGTGGRGAPGVVTPGVQIPGTIAGGQGGQGGICGVQSKSKAASIRLYNGQQEYDLWQFDVLSASVQYAKTVASLSGGATTGQGGLLPVNSPGRRGGQTGPGRGGPTGGGPVVPGGGRFPGPGGFQGPGTLPGTGGPIGPGGATPPGGPTFPGRGRE